MDEQWVEIATTESASETKQVAAALAMVVGPGEVITLDGDLGAGKTQFTQGLAEELDIEVLLLVQPLIWFPCMKMGVCPCIILISID